MDIHVFLGMQSFWCKSSHLSERTLEKWIWRVNLLVDQFPSECVVQTSPGRSLWEFQLRPFRWYQGWTHQLIFFYGSTLNKTHSFRGTHGDNKMLFWSVASIWLGCARSRSSNELDFRSQTMRGSSQTKASAKKNRAMRHVQNSYDFDY